MAGTYLAVKPDMQGQAIIKTLQKQAKISKPVQKEKLHCTLMYSPKDLKHTYTPDPEKIYEADVVGTALLGDVGSKWRALVLKLKCPALNRRHNLAVSRGLQHSYPEYDCHISLAYGEEADGYKIYLDQYLAKSPQLKIRLTSEYMEDLKDD